MEQQAAINAVQALLRQGDTAAALETFRLFLTDNKLQYADTLQALNTLEAAYNTTRQNEFKGILAPEETQREYNRIILNNGQEIRGLIVSQVGRRMFIETEGRSFVLSADEVKEVLLAE